MITISVEGMKISINENAKTNSLLKDIGNGAKCTTKIPSEQDVLEVEKLIGSKFPSQLRSAILKYGYICRGPDEWLGIRNGIDPEKQSMTIYYKSVYKLGNKPEKRFYPISPDGFGNYLCVGEDNKMYEYIHDSKNPIVDFSKLHKVPECKDFNWYLNNVMLGTKDYYGK